MRGLAAQQRLDADAERVTVWECIGCGKIEGPQPCIGVCQDRRVEFVYAADYDGKSRGMAELRRQMDILTMLVRQIACTTPHGVGCERTYRVMQNRARRILREMMADKPISLQGSRNAQT